MWIENYYEHLKKQDFIIQCAEYIIDYDMTVREVAENMMVGKSTVHRWVTKELRYINDDLYWQCKRILESHSIRNQDEKGRFKKVK